MPVDAEPGHKSSRKVTAISGFRSSSRGRIQKLDLEYPRISLNLSILFLAINILPQLAPRQSALPAEDIAE